MADLNGQTIDHYLIERFIGQGGMGSVYQARDLSLQRQVALKVIHAHLAAQSEFRQIFLQQIRTIAAFDHPNIVHIIAHDYKDDLLFIAMEYIAGENVRLYLDKQIRSGVTMRPDVVIELALQVSDALKYAHNHETAHRNLKPENILFRAAPLEQNTADVKVAVSDFGLAQLASQLNSTTVGFPTAYFAYMSPEQASGQAVDHRTDLYALGTILYELSTGKPPFSPRSLPEAFNILQTKPVVPPSKINTHIPSNLEAIILKCLKKDINARYQTADALIADLQKIRTTRFREEVVEVAVLPDLDYEDTEMMASVQADVQESAQHIPLPAMSDEPDKHIPTEPLLKTESLIRPVVPGRPQPVQQSASPAPAPIPLDKAVDLVIVQDKRPIQRIRLDSNSRIIGRDEDCDIPLDHHRVSRHHLQLERDVGGDFYVTDLQSTNGTWVNNIQLIPRERTVWPRNAIVRIGDLWMSLDYGQSPEQMVTYVFTGQAPALAMEQKHASVNKVDGVLIPETITLEPGNVGNVLLEIINDSAEANHFHVSFLDLPAGWFTQPEHSIRVDAHQSTTVTLTLHPLRTSSSTPGPRPFFIEIVGLNASRLSSRIAGQIDVTEFTAFNAEIRPQRITSRQQVFIVLTNLGNRSASYWIAADLYQGDVDFEIPGDAVVVQSGQTINVPVRVIAQRRPILFGQKELPFTLIVSDDEGNDTQQGGVLVARPILSIWILLFWSLIILIGCTMAAGLGFSQYSRVQNQNGTATSEAIAAINAALATSSRVTEVAFQATVDASDPDGDGLSNTQEAGFGTNKDSADTDSDGLNDGDEISSGTDPKLLDTDSDGLNDREEVEVFNTSPIASDSDGDGLSDSDEIRIHRTEPLLTDTDNDGLSDPAEIQGGLTSPSNPDTDSDGIRDNEDVNALGTPDPLRPDEFVRFYYVQINNRSYDYTWPLMTAKFREASGSTSRESHEAQWNNVGRVVIGDIYTVSQDEITACVYVELTYEMNDGTRRVDNRNYVILLLDSSTSNWLIDEQIDGH